MSTNEFEEVWRREAPHVLGALACRHDNFADCEDAVQLALVAASEQWPRDGQQVDPTPAATLGRAIATAESVAPDAGLDILAQLAETSHRRHAAAAH